MEYLIDENRPIFVQIAERIEEDILAGRLAEEEQVPSTNQFAAGLTRTLDGEAPGAVL